MYTIVLLIEQPLSDLDVAQVTSLHSGEEQRFVVLVAAETSHPKLLEVLDDLALGYLREAGQEAIESEPSVREAVEKARAILDQSVAALRDAGVEAAGQITPKNPLEALQTAVRQHAADEVIVLTKPHLVEEFFHRDWASRARKVLGDTPVLRLFAHAPARS